MTRATPLIATPLIAGLLVAAWPLAGTARAEPPVRRLAADSVVPLLGHVLADREGEQIGHVVDILAGPDGAPRAAIADIGGFMGLGARRVAIAWDLLRFRRAAAGWSIAVDAPGAAVAAAPAFPDGAEGIPVLSAAP